MNNPPPVPPPSAAELVDGLEAIARTMHGTDLLPSEQKTITVTIEYLKATTTAASPTPAVATHSKVEPTGTKLESADAWKAEVREILVQAYADDAGITETADRILALFPPTPERVKEERDNARECIVAVTIERNTARAERDAANARIRTLTEQVENQACIIRDTATPASERECRMLKEIAGLRDELQRAQKEELTVVAERQRDQLQARLTALQAERDALQTECHEQARLLGMSGSREAALIAKNDALVGERDEAKRSCEEQFRLYCEETKKHNATAAQLTSFKKDVEFAGNAMERLEAERDALVKEGDALAGALEKCPTIEVSLDHRTGTTDAPYWGYWVASWKRILAARSQRLAARERGVGE